MDRSPINSPITKYLKPLVLLFFTLFLSLSTFYLCRLIGWEFYFDKFIYQKDPKYGYIVGSDTPLSQYGERARVLAYLNNPQKTQVLGDNSDKYSILLIGDSYVWGQGLTNAERFAVLLEKKLNAKYPTNVISISRPGWGLLDYLDAYQSARNFFKSDLVIFSLVSNDALINPIHENNPILTDCTTIQPNSLPVYDIDTRSIDPQLSREEAGKYISTSITKSWENPINLCVVDAVLSLLPSSNSIYFFPDNYNSVVEKSYIPYLDHLKLAGKSILSSSQAKDLDRYHRYYDNNSSAKFSISSIEGHPNALANQMYADLLFQEIITNPDWKFPLSR